MMHPIKRYFVTASSNNKRQWIVSSVVEIDGKEQNSNKIHGCGSKRLCNMLKEQLNHELKAFKRLA